ncbi:MAG TPA: hybrid sensor histidine kinase/response regulator [Candidatus Limnocylindrales bacterium]|nr:hybrid sensor histidine kinase/response regulator [Candidatus Limnocylindrales bacterium]
MNGNGKEFVEIFLQEASERLQFLREYSGILLDAYPPSEDVERLYIAGHALAGTSASYGFPLFSEVAGKLAHIFQYAMNAGIAADAAAALVEFIAEAVALLESDLIIISNNAVEAEEDFTAFKQRYPFAFQTAAISEVESQMSSPGYEPVADPEAGSGGEIPADSAAANELEPMPADDEVAAEVMEFFVPEAEEHLQVVTQCLLSLETNPSADQIHRLLRAMHTIKGSAAQVGLHRISHVAHRAEDLIGRLRDGALHPSAEIIDICLEAVDILKRFLYRQWPGDSEMLAAVQPFFAHIRRLSVLPGPGAMTATGEDSAEVVQEAGLAGFTAEEQQLMAEYAAAKALVAEASRPEPVEKPEEDRRESQAVPHSKSVRIALERLDRMMNAVGELVINRTRMVGRVAELERLADVLNLSKARMMDKVAEFQEKYEFSRIHSAGFRAPSGNFLPMRGGPFDHSLTDFSELEMDRYDDFNILSRSLTEISADITEVLTQLDGFVRRVDSDIDEFTKLAHRLQDEITQARMVPIGNLYTRLTRTVRDAAKAAGKKVDLMLEGAETELDNNIIQQISDPLIHLVRNSVAHGIEREEDRYRLGKSDTGTVTVRAYHRGNHIYIEVEDDGRGIDYDRVRKQAVEFGLVYAEAADKLTEPELLEMLFQPGFSTSPRKTELAGRGVGLDVVRSNLAQLNGEIEVNSEKDRGTRFTLRVPLTLIISQALFVRCGKAMFAMPLGFIEEIRRVKAAEIEDVGGKLLTKVRDAVMEVVRVDLSLGLEPIQPVSGYFRMVIVNATGRQVGLIVEDVVRKDEIVIKNLGEYLRKVKMFPGATIAPDGSLILLLDVNRLTAKEAMESDQVIGGGRPGASAPPSAARVFSPGAEAVARGTIPQEAIDVVRDEKVIVLVDDSISVRKFVGRMLEKAGYRVKLAADGLEALELVAQTRCDLVVTDLEMPRTNGYELLSHLRQSPETRLVPVMVVTSRAGAKHRERAMKEGASAFLTKPVQEDHFIAAVGRLIGVSSSPAASKIAVVQ